MTQDDEIAELLVRWEEAWEHGEELPVDVLCTHCPQHRDTVARRIQALKAMAWVKDAAEEPTEHDANNEVSNLPSILGGRYRIEGLIAEGGYGRVYRGYDPELQRAVAVKIPRTRTSVTPDQAHVLLEEARKLARLRHPGIVAIHDVGRDDGLVFVVSDLIDGENLADRLARSRPSHAEAVALVAEVADALAFAHDQGFVHRDIKPANILIDGKGRPPIADFGIAATLDDLARGRNVASGTLPYMAPEQVAGEVQLIDGRTDLYALGVVLYEMLAGRHPYPARTPTTLREQILFRSPISLRDVDAGISPELERICLRCLAKHPADRYESVREFAADLRSIGPVKQINRRLLGLFLLSVIALVATAGLAWTYLRPRPHGVGTPQVSASSIARDGMLAFDGRAHIVTAVERFVPVTIEAWVRPEVYPASDAQFIVGSDIPMKWGNGLFIDKYGLGAEIIPGATHSGVPVPLHEWSHLTVVFGLEETRLYLNGRKVHVGPKTQDGGGTPFVIGCAGRDLHVGYFIGAMRAVRISQGERYTGDFTPDEVFSAEPADAPNRAVLIYDRMHVGMGRLIDLSGNQRDAILNRP